jgi:hypothetical protein
MANGATLSGLNPDYYLSLKGNENLQVGNIVLSVTTDIARNIYLPKLDSSFARFATGSLHIFIVDITGSAATNNITIYPHPDDKINTGGLGVPLVVNTNSAVVDILSVGNGRWSTANYNGGSGGGGSTISTPITSADFVGSDYVNALLIGKTPQVGFNVFSNDGSGALLDYPNSYSFDGVTGTLTMTAGNYVIQIY